MPTVSYIWNKLLFGISDWFGLFAWSEPTVLLYLALTHWGREILDGKHKQLFQSHLLHLLYENMEKKNIQIYCMDYQQPEISIGSRNGLAPIWRQAISWSKADYDLWRKYAALGLNGLILEWLLYDLGRPASLMPGCQWNLRSGNVTQNWLRLI